MCIRVFKLHDRNATQVVFSLSQWNAKRSPFDFHQRPTSKDVFARAFTHAPAVNVVIIICSLFFPMYFLGHRKRQDYPYTAHP